MINTFFVTSSAAIKWTEVTLNCYKRGCVCAGCINEKILKSTKCKAKSIVMALIKKNIYPPCEVKKYKIGNKNAKYKENICSNIDRS